MFRHLCGRPSTVALAIITLHPFQANSIQFKQSTGNLELDWVNTDELCTALVPVLVLLWRLAVSSDGGNCMSDVETAVDPLPMINGFSGGGM